MAALSGPDARRIWLQLHLWLGLTLGVLGALVGLTGSVLVFDHEVDALLNPQRYAVTGSQVALPYADYLQRAAQAVGGGARPTNLRLPQDDGAPVVVFVRGRGEGAGLYRVYLDPPTGRVLDAAAGGGFIGWAHNFHESLSLREHFGREIVGAVGIAMLISSLSGLYLWWPRGRPRPPGVRVPAGLHAHAQPALHVRVLRFVRARDAVVHRHLPRVSRAGARGRRRVRSGLRLAAWHPGARVAGSSDPAR